MSLRNTVLRLRSTPPRVAALIRAQRDESLPGPKQMTARQIANRVDPLLPFIASGQVPVDDPTVQAGVGRAIEKLWDEQERKDA